MRLLICLLVITVGAFGQDTLITKAGMSYIGEFIEQTDTHVVFQAVDAPNPQSISLNLVDGIKLDHTKSTTNRTDSGSAGNTVNDGSMEDGTALDQQEGFRKGSISAGSLLNYSSYKSDPDDEDPNTVMTVGEGVDFFALTFKPSINYFIMDNVSIDAIIGFTKLSSGDYESSYNVYGAGASYYLNSLYLGAGYATISSGSDDYDASSSYIELHAGVLQPLVQNVYLDVGVSYLMGTGEHTSEYVGEEMAYDNEETMITVSLGIRAIFFK